MDTEPKTCSHGDLYVTCSACVEIELLRAENARLQSEIDAANAQDPVCKIIRNEAGQVSIKNGEGDYFDMSKYVGFSLYARPIPAQQSPAVAVPIFGWFMYDPSKPFYEGFIANLGCDESPVSGKPDHKGNIWKAIKLYREPVAHPSPRITEQCDKLAGLVVQELYNNGGPHESQLDEARRIIGFIASRLPQRVTEQDAREILCGYYKWREDVPYVYAADAKVHWDIYLAQRGYALLNKLNKV